MGVGGMWEKSFNSVKNSLSQIFSFPVCTSAWHSASVELVITLVECCETQLTKPPKRKKKYPNRLFESTSVAKLASHMPPKIVCVCLTFEKLNLKSLSFSNTLKYKLGVSKVS